MILKKNIDERLINELPHIYEIEDLLLFCKKYEHLYIYGRLEQEEYLLKYLDMCNINIDGYVITRKGKIDEENFRYKVLPVVEFNDIRQDDNTGIIMALPERYYDQIIPMFRACGYTDYFLLTDYNNLTITNQVHPRTLEGISLEISLADHCNLSCQMCDHYAQLADEWYIDMESYKRDVTRVAQLCEHRLMSFTLLGGEPTLYPQIIECMKIAREQFPDTRIDILTNGIKLFEWENSENGNLWEACHKYNIEILVTVYPINIDYDEMEKLAAKYDVKLTMSSDIHGVNLTKTVKISDKHTMDLTGSVGNAYSVACPYFNKFGVLKDGKIYMCPIAAHIDIFNKHFNQQLEITEEDYLDIFKISSWKEIAEFRSRSTHFCSYCDQKKWTHYGEWRASTKKIDEYI